MITIISGDCRAILPTLADASVQCCVTSPPYYGLRDYGVDGQIGLEPTPDEYVAEMVAVFREVRRVLRDDGTLWLNIGDSYSAGNGAKTSQPQTNTTTVNGERVRMPRGATPSDGRANGARVFCGMPKPKDLLGIPWLLAFALRADGWYLRSDIIWHKPNPMPESVRDRPTSAHEHVFLLTKRGAYFYDADAIKDPSLRAGDMPGGNNERGKGEFGVSPHAAFNGPVPEFRNARNVWTIATQPFSGAHFATMPPDLAERCIKAGTKPGDTVLDPFGGAGTTGLVADRLNRNAILIELNSEYRALAANRLQDDAPLLTVVA